MGKSHQPTLRVLNRLLDDSHADRLRPLSALFDFELNALVFLERPVSAPTNFRVVNEHIFCAAIGGDETEAFIAIEPLHSSLCHTLSTSVILNRCQRDIPGKASTADRINRTSSKTSVAQHFSSQPQYAASGSNGVAPLHALGLGEPHHHPRRIEKPRISGPAGRG